MKRLRTALIAGAVALSVLLSVASFALAPAPAAIGQSTAADADLLTSAPAKGGMALLAVNAMNDRPGPVHVLVEGWDVKGNPTFTTTMMWGGDDNSFSMVTWDIPKRTRVLRLTFVNDVCGVAGWPCDPVNFPDADRNAWIDYFMVNHLMYEAEDFDRTDGTDPNPALRGCNALTLTSGETVADCGNQEDFVEYDLHPGNPVGPGPGPGQRKGPKV